MSNSPVIAFLNKMTDLILLNVLWILCCLPVITAGAATTAAYYVSITSIRCGDGYVIKRFFESFKKNFRQITPVWLAILFFGLIMTADMLFWYRQDNNFGKTMFIISGVVAFLFFIWILWIFPVFAKLEGKTGQLLRNAVAFAIGYLPYTAVILVITGAVVYANLVSLIANSIMLFVGFAVMFLCTVFLFLSRLYESY